MMTGPARLKVRTSGVMRRLGLITIVLLLLGCCGDANAATTCHARKEPAADRPSLALVRASGIPCWHVTHDEQVQGEPNPHCETILDCIDSFTITGRAVARAPGGEIDQPTTFPAVRFQVTVHWHPCLIPGVYVGGCGHIPAVPERWSCSAAYTVIPLPGGGSDNEWVGVTCRRGSSTVYARLTD
jgi:hypothetical protein